MRKKYKILQTDKPEASEDQLNEQGMAGWALVAIVCWQEKWYYYFMQDLDA